MTKPRTTVLVCAGLIGFLPGLPHPAAAAWPTDPAVNFAISVAAGDQLHPAITTDGAGGAIITWTDHRAGFGDIHAQRVTAGGAPQWSIDGQSICAAAGTQSYPGIVSDGVGGAIIAWQDDDIHAQRISADGTVQWAAAGVALCVATGGQLYPQVTTDGAGGAIVAWTDSRTGAYDIYAQRISAQGAVQWTADGVPLCTVTGDQTNLRIAPDGQGGAIVTWEDRRAGGSYYDYADIYAQRVAANGAIQWISGGVVVCTVAGYQQSPTVVSNGAGAAFVFWEDKRGGTYYDLYAQRITDLGTVQWSAGGRAICLAAGNQQSPVAVADGAGGAIVAWYDARNDNDDIYAQRISGNGSALWSANGAALCAAPGTQMLPAVVADGAGGALVTWQTYVDGYRDIGAQKILANGTSQWTTNGVELCTAVGDQEYAGIVGDGAGGCIVTWEDRRRGDYFNADIYAQRVQANGQPGGFVSGVPEAPAFSLRSYPNPFNPLVTIRFDLPVAGPVRLSIHDVAGRLIRTLVDGSLAAAVHEVSWDGRDSAGRAMGSGSYLARLEFAGRVEAVGMGLVR